MKLFKSPTIPLLDPSWVDRAHQELNENPATTLVSLKRLRKLIYAEKKDDNQEYTRTDDAFLLRFLRAKKFDVDKALKMVSGGAEDHIILDPY